MNCLEVKNLNFSYRETPVLENISFDVEEGEYLGVIGPNGGGKTTLIKLILGLLKPSSGTIKIFGHDIEHFEYRSQIGYVPQKSSQADLEFPASVLEIVKSGRTPLKGVFQKFNQHDLELVHKALKLTDLEKYKTKRLRELSGGERQKVYIARALVAEPKILILDEPTVAIDRAGQEKFYNFLSDLNKNLGITILFVSHDLEIIANEVSSILCLNRSFVCQGDPREIIKPSNLEKVYGKKFKHITHGH